MFDCCIAMELFRLQCSLAHCPKLPSIISITIRTHSAYANLVGKNNAKKSILLSRPDKTFAPQMYVVSHPLLSIVNVVLFMFLT